MPGQALTWPLLCLQTPEDNEFKEYLWGCGQLPDKSFINYPHFKHQLLHPCRHLGGKCCNGTKHAPFMLRLTSYFHAEEAALMLAYDAYPVCGDGFDFLVRCPLIPLNTKPQPSTAMSRHIYSSHPTLWQVTHYPADRERQPEVIVNAGYDPVSKTSRPQRQKLEVPITFQPGDQLDLVVDPRHNHDCDGLYIVELKIWPAVESEHSWKKSVV